MVDDEHCKTIPSHEKPAFNQLANPTVKPQKASSKFADTSPQPPPLLAPLPSPLSLAAHNHSSRFPPGCTKSGGASYPRRLLKKQLKKNVNTPHPRSPTPPSRLALSGLAARGAIAWAASFGPGQLCAQRLDGLLLLRDGPVKSVLQDGVAGALTPAGRVLMVHTMPCHVTSTSHHITPQSTTPHTPHRIQPKLVAGAEQRAREWWRAGEGGEREREGCARLARVDSSAYACEKKQNN